MSERRMISIAMFLTAGEIKRAAGLYKECSPGAFAGRCAKEIIEPVMDRINKKLGQENNALYLAYMVEYTLIKSNYGE